MLYKFAEVLYYLLDTRDLPSTGGMETLSWKAWENWPLRVQSQGVQQGLWVTPTLTICFSSLPSVRVQIEVICCTLTLPTEGWGAWLLLVRNQLVL